MGLRRLARLRGLRALGIVFVILSLVHTPLPQPDFHNIRHHDGPGEICTFHDHLLRWHPDAGLADDVAVLHWHWFFAASVPSVMHPRGTWPAIHAAWRRSGCRHPGDGPQVVSETSSSRRGSAGLLLPGGRSRRAPPDVRAATVPIPGPCPSLAFSATSSARRATLAASSSAGLAESLSLLDPPALDRSPAGSPPCQSSHRGGVDSSSPRGDASGPSRARRLIHVRGIDESAVVVEGCAAVGRPGALPGTPAHQRVARHALSWAVAGGVARGGRAPPSAPAAPAVATSVTLPEGKLRPSRGSGPSRPARRCCPSRSASPAGSRPNPDRRVEIRPRAVGRRPRGARRARPEGQEGGPAGRPRQPRHRHRPARPPAPAARAGDRADRGRLEETRSPPTSPSSSPSSARGRPPRRSSKQYRRPAARVQPRRAAPGLLRVRDRLARGGEDRRPAQARRSSASTRRSSPCTPARGRRPSSRPCSSRSGSTPHQQKLAGRPEGPARRGRRHRRRRSGSASSGSPEDIAAPARARRATSRRRRHATEDVTAYPIVAPFDGTIIAQVGRPQPEGRRRPTSLFTLADLSTVWVMANIPESDLAVLPASRTGPSA